MEGGRRRRHKGNIRLGSVCGSHGEKKISSGYHVMIMRERKKQNVA